ncbi:MAG: 1-deoxy-D-xylulose-5-phosphate reductoisomerase [Candidatus Paceibacteria bacterium]|jgi:1-deoxy-D-xylulose-5-phosphate reductoisomerase
MKQIALLGSTGSIGTQTLDLVAEPNSGLEVSALAAGRSWEKLLDQVQRFQVPLVALANEEAGERLRPHLPPSCQLFTGPHAVVELLASADYSVCVHGIVGAAGLAASRAVLCAGKTLALANKESLVVGGDLLMGLAKEYGGEIIPVDSEHSAIFQCLRGEDLGRVRKIWLTASGGPLRQTPAEEMQAVTPEMALAHPNWDMGPRVTVGSATLMNKALEVIEVHHLFGMDRERIQVAIHPQSIVHSMVEFVDGSVIAQLGPPDMRGPIHFALHHPDRGTSRLKGFDIASMGQLTFEEPDLARFPALELGFRCVEEGQDSGSVLNAADEVTVEAFLDHRIHLTDIPRINAAALDARPGLYGTLDELMDADARGRALAETKINTLSKLSPR